MLYISSTNEERTTAYFNKFNREKVLMCFIKKQKQLFVDIGANIGDSLEKFKTASYFPWRIKWAPSTNSLNMYEKIIPLL